ncbi:hypothetical protein M441DRAFT_84931 [Trichoderma asperellum CBS 433.97]|uniref:Arrestin-like N-terminal domain-containing protein n=1 Tax=Trichoderma asperellum (strain ATCC 204424 / CBS 433.97 / NBRC 101777) TaxID=1042311 RepID=A0A2T3YR87_TRIA4|nr:hypothetical protein M441DRAFT_84931 [Trichoderma asperellum CBS 433.97]PTB35034.1 hypothetical protein M441DRAFT_84931 [Trichoderma asperellum CBS 433.97]
MKLALTIDHEFSPPSFRPGDSLRGTLEIRGCFFKHLPRITATLWGRLKVKASPDFNTCYPTEYNYMLFEQSEDLKILQPSPANDSPNGCVYLCPIEFKFPTGLNCACNETCQLPSSMSVNNGKLWIKSTYLLSAAVERRILGKITKRKRVQRELLFSCNPIIIDLAASCTVALSADKLKQSFTRGSRDIVRPNLDESLPLYSPSLHMEIILPEPPLLIRGRGTPVRLMLHTPRELMQGADIYVRSVEIQMQTTMSAFLQPTWQNITETRHANTMNGAVQIKSEHFELNLGAWGTFIVTQSRPSLNSCLLKIDYAIQVIAGISNGLESSIQYLKASLDVLVMDPPPTYQAAAHNMV